MSHIAIVRSSSRAAHQKAADSKLDESVSRNSSVSNQIPDSFVDHFSGLSVISLSSGDCSDGEAKNEANVRRMKYKQPFDEASTSSQVINKPRPAVASLDRLDTLAGLESCFDADLHQINVLDKLEQRWLDINSNIEEVLDHLQECGKQVTEASKNCLKSLVESVDTSCDSIDGEVKALYHLMTKCDELTTKLSVAGTFRDEIKTLKKSVETLEQLYKSRPQPASRERQ